ncbi:integrase arm-type DNA-binding domain-containing protein [Methylocystis sp. NLS-7]|nr:integrase arm-type DNA-binding domain-containing protein [Methylocystis suflitae]
MGGKLTVARVRSAPPGNHLDGGGLYLFVSTALARSWVYRFSWQGRRPEMGLGSFPEVGLADARDARDTARAILRSGRNPIDARRMEKTASKSRPTFGDIADKLIEAKAPGWRSAKHAEQWRVTLREGVIVPLRNRFVDEIDTEVVLGVLKEPWTKTPESASRLRQRIEAVLDAAKAQGHRTGENPARWRGHLSHLLPQRPAVEKGHHAAMPYAQVPAFVARLRKDDAVAARALEFTILTAARSGEVFGATWPEIDLTDCMWIVPGSRMKNGRTHRIPLAPPAAAILRRLSERRTCNVIFESPRGGRPLSHVSMQKVLDRLGVLDATVHGFRSAFRDWAGNETDFPREVCEAALAHAIGDKAEQAYRRGDALEKRRALMKAWGLYCQGDPK